MKSITNLLSTEGSSRRQQRILFFLVKMAKNRHRFQYVLRADNKWVLRKTLSKFDKYIGQLSFLSKTIMFKSIIVKI